MFTYSIKNMLGGVSGQPPSVRLQNQCEEMINCVPSVTDFLKRREGSENIAKLAAHYPETAFIDFIRRGDREAGIVVINGGTASVYDLAGRLVGSAQSDYFISANQRDDLRLLTVKDYNFILNKSKKIESTLGLGSDPFAYLSEWPFGTVFIKQAAYNTRYSVTVRGKEYWYKTPANDDNGAYTLSSSNIARELYSRMTQGEGLSLSSAEVYQNILLIKNARKPSGIYESGFSVSCDDGMGGNYMTCFYNSVRSFSELPLKNIGGNIIKIYGSESTIYDDYYVEFVRQLGTLGDGYWRECAKGDFRHVPKNMPVALKITANGVSLHDISWKGREAGDGISSPTPSFIGKNILDIFFYCNRLCFLTSDSICMSEAGEYFNFFNTTAVALLESDPIDAAVGGVRVSPLRYAVPCSEGLFLYSGTAVFAVEHGEVLSASSITIRPIIEFDADLTAKPILSGTSIFYAALRGKFSCVREYRPDTLSDLYGSSWDITAHVPRYITGKIRKITASLEEGAVFALTGGSEVYVYNYQDGAAGERVQSAWGKWVFSGDVLNAEVINGVLYMVTSYQDGVYLEKITLNGDGAVLKDRAGLADEDFKSVYVYSPQFLKRDAAGRLQLRTLTLRYTDSGKFKIILNRRGRKEEERLITPHEPAGTARVMLLSRSEDINIRIESVGADKFKLTESRFEASFAGR